MALSALADKAHQPTDKDLRFVLGKAHTAWAQLIELVSDRIGPISQVWGFTSVHRIPTQYPVSNDSPIRTP